MKIMTILSPKANTRPQEKGEEHCLGGAHAGRPPSYLELWSPAVLARLEAMPDTPSDEPTVCPPSCQPSGAAESIQSVPLSVTGHLRQHASPRRPVEFR